MIGDALSPSFNIESTAAAFRVDLVDTVHLTIPATIRHVGVLNSGWAGPSILSRSPMPAWSVVGLFQIAHGGLCPQTDLEHFPWYLRILRPFRAYLPQANFVETYTVLQTMLIFCSIVPKIFSVAHNSYLSLMCWHTTGHKLSLLSC